MSSFPTICTLCTFSRLENLSSYLDLLLLSQRSALRLLWCFVPVVLLLCMLFESLPRFYIHVSISVRSDCSHSYVQTPSHCILSSHVARQYTERLNLSVVTYSDMVINPPSKDAHPYLTVLNEHSLISITIVWSYVVYNGQAYTVLCI